MKKVLALVMIIASIWGFLVAADLPELLEYKGFAVYNKTHLYLQTDASMLRLLLAPKSYLDSLDFHPNAGDSLSVQGWLQGDKLLVSRIYTGDYNNLYLFRNEEGLHYFGDIASYAVDPKKCISCKLCVSPCPTGAITISNGKATINPDKCIECGICIDGHNKFKGCPVSAIKK